jgi:SAM-dependent methyltransferase
LFSKLPSQSIDRGPQARNGPVAGENLDERTVAGFGDEWSRFSYEAQSPEELDLIFAQYFNVFPWDLVTQQSVGADIGAGSGRWAARVARRVKVLHAIDASADALAVARRNLSSFENVRYHLASVDQIPIAEASLDFAYSLGVLHHVPDTEAAIRSCARLLKPGAPLLLYLYYSLDNRNAFYRAAFSAADQIRRRVSRLPHGIRYAASQVLAATVYWPLARSARALEKAGLNVEDIPLSYYRDRSFYVMRNDALDRFGTPLEQRFSRSQISDMMRSAGLERIVFSDSAPFWCAVGYRSEK